LHFNLPCKDGRRTVRAMPIVRSHDGPFLQILKKRAGRAAGSLMVAFFSGPGYIRRLCCMIPCTILAVSIAEGSVLWANKVRKKNLKRRPSLEMQAQLRQARARKRGKRAVSSCHSEDARRSRLERDGLTPTRTPGGLGFLRTPGGPRYSRTPHGLRASRCTPAPCTPDSRRDVGNGRLSFGGGGADDAVPIIPCRAIPPPEEAVAESEHGEAEQEEGEEEEEVQQDLPQEVEDAEEVEMLEVQDAGMQMEDDDHGSAAEEQECDHVEQECVEEDDGDVDEGEEKEDEQMDAEECDLGTPRTPSTGMPNVSDPESVNKRCSDSIAHTPPISPKDLSSTGEIQALDSLQVAMHKKDDGFDEDPEDHKDDTCNDDKRKISERQTGEPEREPSGEPSGTPEATPATTEDSISTTPHDHKNDASEDRQTNPEDLSLMSLSPLQRLQRLWSPKGA